MKYKEVKENYQYRNINQLHTHSFVGDNGKEFGEHRHYFLNGRIFAQYFYRNGREIGEYKVFADDGELLKHQLLMGRCVIASVTTGAQPDTHSEEELIEIAKEHNLPLLSELPKTEEEVTHWNLKWPDLPCLPIES